MEVRRSAPRLSSEEVALVLRRAADLEAEAEGPGAVDGIDPAAVEDAAREVGLSPVAVRQALAELHAGALTPAGTPARRPRLFGSGGEAPVAVEARLVTTTPETVHATAESFLRRQAFAVRRRQLDRAIYRRRTDVGARMRRLANLQGSIHLSGVRSVTLAVTAVDTEPPPAWGDDATSAWRTTTAEPSAPPEGLGAGDTPTTPMTAPGEGGAGAMPTTPMPPTTPMTAPTSTTPMSPTGGRHVVRLEAELASGRIGARLRATSAAVAIGSGVAVAGLLVGVGVVAVAAGIGGTVGIRAWFGRRLLHQRRDEVREVLAALLDVIEDPDATHHRALSPRPGPATWWSSWTRSPSTSRWSARGQAHAGWTIRSDRSSS